MIVVFPCSSDSQTLPHSKFLKESLACDDLGIPFTTFDLRALQRGDSQLAFQKTARVVNETGIYRGGTIRPLEYAILHASLAERGIHLVASLEQFAQAQLFNEFFPRIADVSLPAITTNSLKPDEVADAMSPPPYFLKDYVKSAKEVWPRGCVVPAPGTVEQFAQTIAQLREYRADRFETGLVVRPLVRLRSLGLDPFGDECCEEYRMIFLRGKRIFAEPYGYHRGSFTDFARFDDLGERFSSPFFMADCVVAESGECYLLETGDGGCCGLPPALDCREFYCAVADRFG